MSGGPFFVRTECGNPILSTNGPPFMSTRRTCAILCSVNKPQCTGEYKLKPLKAAVRALLGYPHPTRVPRGVYADQAIGISTDEIHRAKDSDVNYTRNIFPLLDLGMSRTDCR